MQSEPKKPFSIAGLEAFWLSFWLAILFFVCKAYYFGQPDPLTLENILNSHGQTVCVSSGADMLFCAIAGLIAWPLLAFTYRKQTRLFRSLRVAIYALFVLFAFYGILSVKIFEYLRTPLTYTMLYLAGDTSNMRSSVFHYAAWGIALALVFGPFFPVLAAWVSCRFLSFKFRVRFLIPAFLLVLSIYWSFWAHSVATGAWVGSRDDRRIADNPHYALSMSFIKNWFGADVIHFNENFPPEFADDFKTVAHRNGAAPTPNLPRKPKNVIVIISESVGYQMLSPYGAEFNTWPNIQAETQNALVFDNYYSHIGNTANSLVSILLSVYTPPLDFHEITKKRPTLKGVTAPQVLKPLGYRTAFLSAGDNDFSGQSELLKNRGFDAVWDFRQSGATPHFSWGVADKYLVDMTLKFISQDSEKPFFIYAWTQGTHHNYEPYEGQEIVDFKVDEKKWKGMSWDLDRYLNALREEDRQIGRLLNELRARHLDDDTLVVITGDHGEAFGYPHEAYGHSGKIHQEDVHVPFIIWSPALFKNAPRNTTAVGGHVDLTPTILDLLNIPLPETWQGASLLSPNRPNRAYFYGVMDNHLIGVREGDFKYIYNATEGYEFLYNLKSDPNEKSNLAKQYPDLCNTLRQRLAAWVKTQDDLEKTW